MLASKPDRMVLLQEPIFQRFGAPIMRAVHKWGWTAATMEVRLTTKYFWSCMTDAYLDGRTARAFFFNFSVYQMCTSFLNAGRRPGRLADAPAHQRAEPSTRVWGCRATFESGREGGSHCKITPCSPAGGVRRQHDRKSTKSPRHVHKHSGVVSTPNVLSSFFAFGP